MPVIVNSGIAVGDAERQLCERGLRPPLGRGYGFNGGEYAAASWATRHIFDLMEMSAIERALWLDLWKAAYRLGVTKMQQNDV